MLNKVEIIGRVGKEPEQPQEVYNDGLDDGIPF